MLIYYWNCCCWSLDRSWDLYSQKLRSIQSRWTMVEFAEFSSWTYKKKIFYRKDFRRNPLNAQASENQWTMRENEKGLNLIWGPYLPLFIGGIRPFPPWIARKIAQVMTMLHMRYMVLSLAVSDTLSMPLGLDFNPKHNYHWKSQSDEIMPPAHPVLRWQGRLCLNWVLSDFCRGWWNIPHIRN